MHTRSSSHVARTTGLITTLALALIQTACGGGQAEAEAASDRRGAAAASVATTAPEGGAPDAESRHDEPIEIDVHCCDEAGVEEAVGLVWALQAAQDLPRSVPVLVRSEDERLAAAAARRLADGGLTHVWVLRP